MPYNRGASFVKAVVLFLLLLIQLTTIDAYFEEDDEIEDKELTVKLWQLVDQLDQEQQQQQDQYTILSFSERTKQGSIGYFSPDTKCQPEDENAVCSSDSSDDEECVDLREDCERIAQLGDCLYDDEAEDCRKTCLICRSPDHESFAIGKPQTFSEKFIEGILEDVEDIKDEWSGMDLSALNLDLPVKDNDELLQRLAKQIMGTQTYMSEIVMQRAEYENVRRSCLNYLGHCEIYAAIGYCDNNFMGGEDFLMMRQKCAPACRSCDEYELLQPCTANYDHNFVHEGDIDKIFRRMVGELGDDGDKLPYKASIHARPGGESKEKYVNKDGKISKSSGAVDGAWLITLEDFLTPEECDRMIELGKLEGYSRSGLQEGKDKKNHRTSVNAWCSEKHCDKDPIAQRVVERISNTTGMPAAYSEPLQLLKYTEGQYYKMHHDVDLPKEQFWPQGPRVMTFFLYLNEVEEGGATRMVDITYDDNDSAPGDHIDECVDEAKTPEDKAACALIEMDIKPKRGMALVWPNVLDSDMKQKEPGTWHEARPVIKGVKYGANAWFRLRRFERECHSEEYEAWLDKYNMTYDYEDDGGDDDDDDATVLVMETLEEGATSNTKVESKKEKTKDDKQDASTTTITTTTTTVNKTPTTITTTTTQVITTTTVTKIDEKNDNGGDDDDAAAYDDSISEDSAD